MPWIRLLVLSILQFACATSTPHRDQRRDAGFTLKEIKPIMSKRDLSITDSVFLLKEVGAVTKSTRRKSPSLLTIEVDLSTSLIVLLSDATGETTPLNSIEDGVSFAVDVELSGQSYQLTFDTGSSDLWVAQAGFLCVNAHGNVVAESRCHFGKLFTGTFDEGKVPNQHINIQYGSGEVVAGVLGYEDVTVAGVTVDHQEIGLIREAFWDGDDVTSGILGFAYSTITDAYKGNNLAGYNPANLVPYTNFIGNVVKQGKIDPSFSIVLERNGGQSQLALGGLPTTSFNHDFTTVPLEIYEFSPKLPIGATHYTYYTIEVDGFVLNANTVGSSVHAIVDSGTTIAYLPAAITEAFNRAFDPPATLKGGLWEVRCDATPPSFSVRIGGTDFVINSAELLPPQAISYDPKTGLCVCRVRVRHVSNRLADVLLKQITGIQSSKGIPPVLGGTFLKNVVAVFDIGAAEMRFAPHVNY